jgi:RNA polymerase sigma-70 factor (ECF subfamily)
MPEMDRDLQKSKSRTNSQWIADLRGDGILQEQAVIELREILLRASLYTFHRYTSEAGNLDQDQVLQWAEDCAQDALMAVLNHLSDFRGESKFTTWVYKFAINTVLMSIRHEKWKWVSLDDLEPEHVKSSDPGGSMDSIVVRGEVGEILHTAMEEDLTEKQRQVLRWIVFDEIPMDVVVERLGTNRNAIYQLLHDARRKLKQKLSERGFSIEEILDLYGSR